MQAIEKEYKGKLIYDDTEKSRATIESLEASAKQATENIERVEKTTGLTFTLEEKKRLVSEGETPIMNRLREKFPFPNADDSFNLKAMGLELTGIKQPLAQLPYGFKHNGFYFDGKGAVKIEESKIDEIKVKNRYYTKSPKQDEVFEMAESLAAYLNENMDKISEFMPGRFSKSSNCRTLAETYHIIDVEGGNTDDVRLVPDIKQIYTY